MPGSPELAGENELQERRNGGFVVDLALLAKLADAGAREGGNLGPSS